jgi:hypothetical protein
LNQGDWIKVANVQFEEGSVATEFEYVPYEIQLQRCMRYFEKGYVGGAMHWGTGNEFPAILQFKVVKRIIPSLSFTYHYRYNSTGFSIVYLDEYGGILYNNQRGDYIYCEASYEAEAEL